MEAKRKKFQAAADTNTLDNADHCHRACKAPKPQFQASSKGGQNTSASNSCSTNPANEPVDQPISYADYVVQSKSSVAGPPQRVGPSKLLRTEGDGDSNLKQSDSDSVRSAPGLCETVQDPAKGTEDGSDGAKNSEKTQVDDGTHQEEGNCQRSYPSLNLGPKPVGSGSSIIVSPRQKDPHHTLKELARICIMADCTLILAWSPEEAGRYLETYKSYEKKPADLLKEQVEKNYLSQSVEGIISASKEDLVLCPGLGPQKARRLYDVLHKPFLKSKTKDS
ncbi:DNA excision repair protein ERCC-1 [Dissostichus eleginoides]|uniref:DNA excision repair protein ERCC-1 n=1 Tax=Dissostichus eleginoides TaxID=100907 RepID=A0AAD9FEC3_DISEL|nr:DNA excision repair protein ERCC-1 [Dissostichus eleginoides]